MPTFGHWASRIDDKRLLSRAEAATGIRDRRQADAPRVARSARDCFLLNCAENDRRYAEILKQAELHQMQGDADSNTGDLANSGVA